MYHTYTAIVTKNQILFILQYFHCLFRKNIPLTDVKQLLNSQLWKRKHLIGRGRFCNTILYCHNETKCNIAVKEVNFSTEKMTIISDMDALENEISSYEKLLHDRIVKVLGSCKDYENGMLYICLEYMQGGSLYTDLQIKGPLNINSVIKYVYHILEGIAYLHEQHIIHRDVRGKNLLLDQNFNIKLADIGISKQLETLSSTHGSTATDVAIKWTAPEIVIGKYFDNKVDIWSVGCTVVEMLTTQPPWNELSDTEARLEISKGNRPIYTLPPFCDEIENFLLQCFQFDPTKRLSAEELLKNNLFTSAPVAASSSRNTR